MSTEASARVALLGPGSWGTALGLQLCRNGHSVRLWGHEAAQIEAITQERQNTQFLPGFPFPATMTATASLDEALADATDCLVVVPSHAFRQVCSQLASRLPPGLGVAWATKGLESDTGQLLHTVAQEVLDARPLAVVSGPSFAGEVARGLPTAVSVAANDDGFAKRTAQLLHGGRFRAYTSEDMVGVEICGAAKNVLAIATGIADGLGFGANTRAALITRGLAELIRIGTALGGRPETFTGLAGMGDLVLTCTDDQSRNRRMGLALAGGQSVDEARAVIGQEVEGVITAMAIHRLSERLGIEMPIASQVYRVLYEQVSPQEATRALLEREPKPEFG
ncbi:NAD(P)-dependent glycerol-3-phosphate dehydrogenase [Thiorhodococcus mannitoliphagus]|uniref:Glycerol-3-phosphate dehydrogenase [NAD(P)+] n=1 Tax=Thiorhodococcus mannitoliphagus TaxID=329406 RepID=A0A6P1DQ13_9GAMM|nr:NAD(P)H-dependent glycerol-3-phosphate dehydrogenase [Thiorhodococcus mannitoliphagus]NEX18756.1 NAD(P)-dependent glycerol-3-phosphate dehydrogenase [Thiorhodococcus mannitoliphagus]